MENGRKESELNERKIKKKNIGFWYVCLHCVHCFSLQIVRLDSLMPTLIFMCILFSLNFFSIKRSITSHYHSSLWRCCTSFPSAEMALMQSNKKNKNERKQKVVWPIKQQNHSNQIKPHSLSFSFSLSNFRYLLRTIFAIALILYFSFLFFFFGLRAMP